MSSPASRLIFNSFLQQAEETELVAEEKYLPIASKSLSMLAQMRQHFCSDEELAKRLQDGDADALTVMFERHSALLFRIARRILHDDAEAEDTVQQIFLDVFRSVHQFNPERGEFKTWLLMFGYHRTFNRRRSLAANKFFATDPLDELLPELLQPMQRGLAIDTGILMEQALSSIQPRQRRTIEMVYYEGLTAEEVASRTGETVRVVRHNLYRGLEKLREIVCGPEKSADAQKRGRR